MSRIGRFVVPDLPHHVTQRRDRRENVFFGDDDYALYRDLLAEACRGVAVWAYCLMPNHVHLILTPQTPEGLGAGARQGAPALFCLRQRADAGDRPPLPVALFLGRDGRRPSDGGGAVCRAEPAAGNARREARGLALVERRRPFCGPRRRPGRGRPAARALCGRFAALVAEEPDPAKSPRCAPPRRSAAHFGAGAFLDRLAALTGRNPRPGNRGRKSRAAQAVEDGAHGGRKK